MPLSKPYIHMSPMNAFGKRQRAIVVIGPISTIPERLKAGLERELPWAVLCEVETVDKACSTFPETVSLILLHPSVLENAESSVQQLRRYHPLALIGLLQLGTAECEKATRELVATSKMLQGFIPMGTRVHEFVAIVSFMLRGGEYFPREIFAPQMQVTPQAPTHVAPQLEPDGQVYPFDNLTRREKEILELVARGLQNKSIAAHLKLSEYTVKIHLHNIITKLGAHNRTEAAAFFRDRQRPAVHAQSAVM
jgi:DNA-binding NarL/FixJ family response regulator